MFQGLTLAVLCPNVLCFSVGGQGFHNAGDIWGQGFMKMKFTVAAPSYGVCEVLLLPCPVGICHVSPQSWQVPR